MANLFYDKKKNYGIFYLILAGIFLFLASRILGVRRTRQRAARNVKNMANLPRWNLNDLYGVSGEPSLEKDLERVREDLDRFTRRYQGNVRKLSGYELYRAIGDHRRIVELLARLESSVLLGSLEETRNRTSLQQIRAQLRKLYLEIAFFSREIGAMTDAELNRRLSDSSNLREHCGAFLEKIRLFRGHQLASDEEYFLGESNASLGDLVLLTRDLLGNMRFRFRGRSLGREEIITLAENSGPESSRAKARKSYGYTLGKNIGPFVHIMNARVRERILSDRLRQFEKPLSSTALANGLEDSVLENLEEVVRRDYGAIAQRYYLLKARIVSRDRPIYGDMFALTLFNHDTEYSWQDAVRIVNTVFEEFSPDLTRIRREFFGGGWLSVSGNRGGGYKFYPTVPGVHPYLSISFRNRAEDIMALGHGLGEAMQYYLLQNRDYPFPSIPPVMSEAIALFAEQLVFDHLRENTMDVNAKITLMVNRIDSLLRALAYDLISLDFENIIRERRKQGELGAEEISSIWLEAWTRVLGDIFGSGEAAQQKYIWVTREELFSDPSQSHRHLLSLIFANVLYDHHRKKNPKDFREQFLRIISLGAREQYYDLLIPLGIDLGKKDIWREGLAVLTDLINELDILLTMGGFLR
jgi:oligoendopeptidase F